MWTFSGKTDPIRLQVPSLPSKTLSAMLELLTGDPTPAALPEDGSLLYNCSGKESFLKLIPPCDEWGLHPKGLVGPRENPILVTLVLGDLAAYAPDVDVEGRTSREAPKVIGVGLTQLGAPEVIGTEPKQLGAPEVVASGAPEVAEVETK
jgi:hypothetical protein